MNPLPVVLFSIDGLRPDALFEAPTPHLKALMERGAHCLTARTVMPSVTLPCHTSMLRGVDVPRHGITSNTFQPLARPVPSLIDCAYKAGKRTGFFFNWAELRDLCEPGSLNVSYSLNAAHSPESDSKIACEVIRHLKEQPFDFLFVYYGHVDERGHQEGWMSEGYLEAVTEADRCVGLVLEEYEKQGREPAVLLQSDHGGHGRSHGTDMPEDMTIPWMLAGPGIKPGPLAEGSVRIFDTCPTLAHLLGIPAAREWEGRIITEALSAN